jgi:hypothetical protein
MINFAEVVFYEITDNLQFLDAVVGYFAQQQHSYYPVGMLYFLFN